jgi:hypothetical protein
MVKRSGPSDPYALQRAKAAAAEKARLAEIAEVAAAVAAAGAARDPGTWGLSADIIALPSAADVKVRQVSRGRPASARRQDVFGHLRSCGSLDVVQYVAINRYCEDRARALGVRTRDAPLDAPPGCGGAGDIVSVGMIDAGRRVAEVERAIGRLNVQLIRALVDPMMAGEVRVWRELVRHVTRETERHAQATAVRVAVENLRLEYEAIDKAAALARKARRAA